MTGSNGFDRPVWSHILFGLWLVHFPTVGSINVFFFRAAAAKSWFTSVYFQNKTHSCTTTLKALTEKVNDTDSIAEKSSVFKGSNFRS